MIKRIKIYNEFKNFLRESDINDFSEYERKLINLIIENFRGVSNYEKIDFSKKYTFIYGPNGSGKSSLCEALEYSMLGYINEAILKRISIEQYTINMITG